MKDVSTEGINSPESFFFFFFFFAVGCYSTTDVEVHVLYSIQPRNSLPFVLDRQSRQLLSTLHYSRQSILQQFSLQTDACVDRISM